MRRLPTFDYRGPNRYSLTFCTHLREKLFTDAPLVEVISTQFSRAADDCRYALVVYCVMPDHVHLYVEGREGCTSLSDFVKRAKQFSGFHGGRLVKRQIWQTGFFERVLRDSEDSAELVAYILGNPVRAKLVEDPMDYPFSGSGEYDIHEVLESVRRYWYTPT